MSELYTGRLLPAKWAIQAQTGKVAMKSSIWAAACAVLALLWLDSGAAAKITIRVGKAQAQQFAFVPVDVGIKAGIFKKHGVDIEIENFAGDAKLLQGLKPMKAQAFFPPLELCTDNGAMIAFAAAQRVNAGLARLNPDAHAFSIRPRWDLADIA